MADFKKPLYDTVGLYTTERPRFNAKVRPLTPLEKNALTEYLKEALAKKWIRKSRSRVSSGILFVPKKNGKLRLCVDYRRLNAITSKVIYAPTNHYATRHDIAAATYFSKMDLKDAFYRLHIREDDRWKTAFQTPIGRFEYNVMPFGAVSAPGEYQIFIETVLSGLLGVNVTVYIDDILCFCDTLEDLQRIVKQVKNRLREHHVTVNEEKSEYNKTKIEYCGHVYRHGEISTVCRTETITEWPTPRGKRELQQFLGFANYYRDHIIDFITFATPLYDAISVWKWTNRENDAFLGMKNAMHHMIELTRHDPLQAATITTDASLFGISAILTQNGKVTAMISRKLTTAERNYDTAERELLAVVYATDKWIWLLEIAPHIEVRTDSKINASALLESTTNRRRNRWIHRLSRFNITWKHVSGVSNPADAPSRRPDYKRGGSARR